MFTSQDGGEKEAVGFKISRYFLGSCALEPIVNVHQEPAGEEVADKKLE